MIRPDFNPLIGLATAGLLGPVVAFLLAKNRKAEIRK
jgi:hypothetical protein